MDLLGDWWTPLVLRELVYGSERFDDIQAALGVGRNVLSQRLQRLEKEGLVARRKYQDHPPRHHYLLTEKGRDFFPVLAMIVRWGDRWLDGGKGPPVLLRHKSCGRAIHGEMVCSHCGKKFTRDDIAVETPAGEPITLEDRVSAIARLNASKSRK